MIIIEKLEVKIKYSVFLGGATMPKNVHAQLVDFQKKTNMGADEFEYNYPEAKDWLVANIKGRDCFDWVLENIKIS